MTSTTVTKSYTVRRWRELSPLWMKNWENSHNIEEGGTIFQNVETRHWLPRELSASYNRTGKEYRITNGSILSKLDLDGNHITSWTNRVHKQINPSTSTRFLTYRSTNPILQYCPLCSCIVPEFRRIACTRLRLSSHKLKTETGRWWVRFGWKTGKIALHTTWGQAGQLQNSGANWRACSLVLSTSATFVRCTR